MEKDRQEQDMFNRSLVYAKETFYQKNHAPEQKEEDNSIEIFRGNQ